MCNALRTLIIGYLICRRKNGTVKIVSAILKLATFSPADEHHIPHDSPIMSDPITITVK